MNKEQEKSAKANENDKMLYFKKMSQIFNANNKQSKASPTAEGEPNPGAISYSLPCVAVYSRNFDVNDLI